MADEHTATRCAAQHNADQSAAAQHGADQPLVSFAFAAAEHQRNVRAEVIAAVTDGALTFEQLLERIKTDEVAATIKLLPVIEVLPGMGKVTSRRLLASLAISESLRLAEILTAPQLADLIEHLNAAQVDRPSPAAEL